MTHHRCAVANCGRAEALPRPGRVRPRIHASTGGPHQGETATERHDRPPELVASHRSRLPRNLEGLRVLVVDDDQDTVDFFAVALEACGAEVTTATSAPTALRLADDVTPHVILSDIAMPDGDGYWLVSEIRRLPDETRRRIPIVAATAFGHEHSRSRALAAGFNEHLQKPVDPYVLCQTVAKVAGR